MGERTPTGTNRNREIIMASIGENLRATLLSLKQISDRVKSLILTSVTKSEAESAKQEILGAIGNIPEPDLSEVAKENTSQEILMAVENIDFSTLAKEATLETVGLDAAAAKTAAQAITGYALQGSNATATNTAILAEVEKVTAVDADILSGKMHLASAITSKGVTSSVSDSLVAMATKVRSIPQQVNTRTSDFEQMIAPYPHIWNVYTVATELMQNELPSYIPSYMTEYRARYGTNSFFVGEYYLGYTTLELTGADGYLTCDGDFYTIVDGLVTHTSPDGTVETYEAESIIHTWHDVADSMANRWIAFFYLADAYSFTNTSSSICPRRVALCGTCNALNITGASSLIDVWVIGTLNAFESGTSSPWNPAQVIRNYKTHTSSAIYKESTGRLLSIIMPDLEETSSTVIYNSGVLVVVFPKLKNVASGSILINYNIGNTNISPYTNIEVLAVDELEELKGMLLQIVGGGANSAYLSNLKQISANKLRRVNSQMMYISVSSGYPSIMTALKTINFPNLEYIGTQLMFFTYINSLPALTEIRLPKLTYCGGFLIRNSGSSGTSVYNTHSDMGVNLIDVEVGEMTTSLNFRSWNPTNVLADTTKKAQLIENIKNHILAKVSDRTGLGRLTFTVRANMYNNIASEEIEWQGETMTLADAFLTKNWLLSGI